MVRPMSKPLWKPLGPLKLETGDPHPGAGAHAQVLSSDSKSVAKSRRAAHPRRRARRVHPDNGQRVAEVCA